MLVPPLRAAGQLVGQLNGWMGRTEGHQRFGEVLRRPSDPRRIHPIAFAQAVQGLDDDEDLAAVLAVRGLGILGLNDSLLRAALTGRLREGRLTVRALLLNPDSLAARRRAAEIGESVESFASGIQLSVARLRELVGTHPAVSLEVYEYDTLPVWRLVDIDGTVYVAVFAEDWEGHESPVYKVTATPRGVLHRGFRRMFEDLRQGAKRII